MSQAMRPQGYAVILDPGAPTKEWDTITCRHCQKIVFVKRDPGGFCRCCMAPLCGICADSGVCTPFEKKLERFEQAAIRGRILERLLASGG